MDRTKIPKKQTGSGLTFKMKKFAVYYFFMPICCVCTISPKLKNYVKSARGETEIT